MNEQKKIDLVYLWVDGKDKTHKEKRNYWLQQEGRELSTEDGCNARWEEISELKYSLRSVEKYAPWINHIFIVTDCQVPQWLNIKHPKITVVDHKDIIPEKYLPLFNSSAIEACIENIKNLSEYFLYANDDMMFGRDVKQSDFFTADGTPIYRVKHKRKKQLSRSSSKYQSDRPGHTYAIKVYRMREIIKSDFGVLCKFAPHHNIDCYKKSLFKEANDKYRDLINKTLENRFRNENEWERSLIYFYGKAKQSCRIKYEKISFSLNYKKYILNKLMKIKLFSIQSILFKPDAKNIHMLFSIKELKPMFYCINDNDLNDDKTREIIKCFFEIMLPDKSDFEL